MIEIAQSVAETGEVGGVIVLSLTITVFSLWLVVRREVDDRRRFYEGE